MLRCSDQSLYTGITNDLERRLKLHNQGKASRYTRARLPVCYVYIEESGSKSEALKREHQIKRLAKLTKEKLVQQYKSVEQRGPE
ncbi:GIY-YIG nuclease family protein [Ammoniphilus oxalaticus]|nr:GIY-YIG nuclease family protein [Ammoniphilus oxalaticus]